MPNYIRNRTKGGCYFFTVNLRDRQNSQLLIEQFDLFKKSVRKVKHQYPFQIHGWVVLPEHTHFIVSLPVDDDDYPIRIRLMKSFFVKQLKKSEDIPNACRKRGERGIWQRRYWEHIAFQIINLAPRRWWFTPKG